MSDYISREKAIKSICQYGTAQEKIGRYAVTISELKQTVADTLSDLPSADVRENIHGKWIDFPDDRVQCSECNVRYPRFHRANFCDNCGADMREFLKNEGHRYDILKGESWG